MDILLEMSAKELSRLEVMQKLSEKRLSQKEAGTILHLSTRQIKRLVRAYRQKGAAGLVSKHRGRKSNNHLAEDLKKQALNLLKTKYKGFGPTLTCTAHSRKCRNQSALRAAIDFANSRLACARRVLTTSAPTTAGA